MLALIFIGIILDHLGLLNGWMLFLYIAALVVNALFNLLKLGFVVYVFEEID